MESLTLIAGVLCVALAAGHEEVGRRWVLPAVHVVAPRPRPFGSSMTAGIVRIAWHIITVFAATMGALLLTLALSDAEPRRVALLWVGAGFLGAAGVALWNGRRRPSSLLRLPVWIAFLAVTALCWAAA